MDEYDDHVAECVTRSEENGTTYNEEFIRGTNATCEFLFDVELFASFRITAHTREGALKLLTDALDCATANFGETDGGQLLVAEASLVREPELVEVDGEAV